MQVAQGPSCNFGIPNISETARARKLKLKMLLNIVKYSPWAQKNVSARGRTGGTGHPSINLGPPNISESTNARKLKLKMLKLKMQSDIVKYSIRV